MSDANSLPDNLDSILRKYGKIWIWSILSAAVAALSVRALSGGSLLQFTAFTTFSGLRANGWSAWPSLLLLVPSFATLASVYYLLCFLQYHILPILFPESSPRPAAPAPQPAPVPQSFTLTGAPIAEYVEAPPPPAAPAANDAPDGAQLLFRAFAAVFIAMALELGLGILTIVYQAIAKLAHL